MVDECDHEPWLEQIEAWRSESQERDILSWPEDGKLYAANVIRDIWDATGGDAIVIDRCRSAPDVGSAILQLRKTLPAASPRVAPERWGSDCPPRSAPGSRIQDREVWVIDGDGSFQMTQAELSTAIQEGR